MKRISNHAVVLLLGTWCASALAHHSFAMFDRNKVLTLKGTVKEFQWTNPHVFIELVVPDDAGDSVWSLEGGSTNMLIRAGWKSSILKPGDKISVKINPLRSDTKHGGAIVEVVLADGRALTAAPRPAN